MTAYLQAQLGFGAGWFVANTILILLIALPVMLAVAMLIYADRKIWAAMALRKGPNVVGPFGLLQSFADGLKVFLQETILPSSADKGLFLLAPIITFTVALIVWAVVPFGPGMVLSDINVGLLYILAASSLGVYGVMMAGWASNSKYPFYSALRAAAQMVSYEVSIGFVLISVVLWVGSFNMTAIVEMQRSHLWITNGFGFNPLFLPMAVVFFISSLAETARAPFDLTEAESELVAGYQTEYSSMSFALFWLGEYANVILMCALNAILFWGGYLPPIDWAPLYVIPGIFWLFLKILIFFFMFSWVKATVPRYRYDQLMRLGWKIFLPLSLVWVVLVSGYLMLTRYASAGGQQPLSIAAVAGPSHQVVGVRHYDCFLRLKSNPDNYELHWNSPLKIRLTRGRGWYATSGNGLQDGWYAAAEFDDRLEYAMLQAPILISGSTTATTMPIRWRKNEYQIAGELRWASAARNRGVMEINVGLAPSRQAKLAGIRPYTIAGPCYPDRYESNRG